MKKIILSILAFVLMFPSGFVYAVTNTEPSLETRSESEILSDLDDSISEISKVIKTIPDIDSETASSLATNFASFMKYAGYAGTVLGLVNGSVAFLKLIGVMKDPTATKLNHISDQIQTINDKMNEMDTKLNDLTSAMSKLEAISEFHERDRKSDYLLEQWSKFTNSYMESTLDASMAEYDAMVRNGTNNWFKNEGRADGDVDTSKVIVLYQKDGNNYTPYQTYLNEVPSNFPSDSRYIVLDSSALPDSLDWDINTYRDTLRSAINQKIYNAVAHKDFTGIKVQNYPFLTKEGAPAYIDQGPTLEINKISDEITEALIYRIVAKEVNKDANFTTKLAQQYTLYTDHLRHSEEGVDAVLKSMFLTHVFEPEVREDLTNFTNYMIVKSGVYGTFVTNVFGMSKFASDEDKRTALDNFGKSIQYIKSAREKGITGKDRYSYITNSELSIIDVTVQGDATLEVRVGPGERRAYKGFSSKDLAIDCAYDFPGRTYGVIGTVPALVLMSTLTANGHETTVDGLREFFGNYSSHGGIITSYKAPEDMALDSSIQMSIRNVSGDYFKDGVDTNRLQGDAELQYVVKKQKLLGDVYFPNTGKLESNYVLGAIGAYAEEHTMWFTDETAFMGGPKSVDTFSDGITTSRNGDNTLFNYKTNTRFNYMVSVSLLEPEETVLLESNSLGADNQDSSYDPLVSYQNIDLTDLGQDEEEESGEVDQTLGIIITSIALVLVFYIPFALVATYKKQNGDEDEETFFPETY